MTDDSAFFKLRNAGYSRLVPIVPPDAAVSPHSSFAKRPKARGKAVGIKGRDGLWRGFDWLKTTTTDADLTAWADMGAGAGIRTGQGIIAIDIDTLSSKSSEHAERLAKSMLGPAPRRIGKAPKVLLPYRTLDAPAYQRVDFDDGTGFDPHKPPRVEILADDRQFVAFGIHPDTGQPYAWPDGLPNADELTTVTAAQVDAYFAALAASLPKAVRPAAATSTDRLRVDQAALTGDSETVAQAVDALPNTSALFPAYDDYVRVGAAIKAATQDDPRFGLDLFLSWADRWDGGNDLAVAEADYNRIKPPFEIGARWLYDKADAYSGGKFKLADVWFEEIEQQPESPFDEQHRLQKSEEPEERNVEIEWRDPADWQGATVPERRWIVDTMIPDGEVTLLTGDGGVGKTLLAQQIGTAVALGVPVFGREVQQSKVMMFLCEDSFDELQLRQRDINSSYCIDFTDLSGSVRIASRKYMDNLLVLWDRNTGAMKRQAVWERLRADAVAFGAKLLIVDTIADTFGGSEIDRAQVRAFVQSCLGRLAKEMGGAVLALGHPSRAGKASGDGTSGSTAWHASVRSRLYLEHAAKDASGPYRKLTNKKANYAAAGDVFMLRWQRGAFEAVSARSTNTVLSDNAAGGASGVSAHSEGGVEGAASAAAGRGNGGVPSLTEAIDAAVLAGIDMLARDGIVSKVARNSSYFAPKVLQARFPDLVGMYTLDELEAGLNRAVEAGRVGDAVIGRKPNRHILVGLAPKRAAQRQDNMSDTPAASVFD